MLKNKRLKFNSKLILALVLTAAFVYSLIRNETLSTQSGNSFSRILLMFIISGLAAILANKGVAVFNDGLRPIIPENLEGRMSRKALAATSFAMSFGLVIGFGIPFSLTAPVILVHSILLGTDIIGTSTPIGPKGESIAGIVGGLYGVGILKGLEFVVETFAKLPVNFLDKMTMVGLPIILAFSVFPAIVVAYQYGYKKGMIAMFITLAARQLFAKYGIITFGDSKIALSPDGMALMVGMVIMLYYAIKDKTTTTGTNATLVEIFADRVKRIKQNAIILAIMGGLIAAASTATMSLLAEGPVSVNLLGEGKVKEAALVSLARAFSFVPLVGTTAIATGVYSPSGMKFVFAIGLFVTNPILAFVLGALIMLAEIFLLEKIAIGLDQFPGIKACGDEIRTAMTKVLEIALLVGGLIAANAISPSYGFLFGIGFYLINKVSKKPIVEMAIGPISVIFIGILVNILFIFGIN